MAPDIKINKPKPIYSPRPLAQVITSLLLTRLFLISLLLTLFAILLTGYFSDRNLRAQQIQRVQLLSERVDSYMQRAVAGVVAAAGLADQQPTVDAQPYLEAIWKSYGFYDDFYRLDAHGIVRQRIPADLRYQGLDLSNQEFFRQVRQTQTAYISEPFSSSVTGQPTLTIAAPLKDGGVWVGELNLQELQAETSVLSRLTEQDTLFIIDRAGILLTHSNPTLVAQRTNLNDIEIVERVKNGPSLWIALDNRPGFITERLMMSAAASVQHTGWIVVAQVPVFSAFGPVIWSIGFTVFVIPAIWLLLILWIRTVFNNEIVRPLERFTQAVRDIGEGRTISIGPIFQASSEILEIDTLAENFNRMSRSVQERELDLRTERDLVTSILAASPEAILIVNLHAVIEDMNPAALLIFGCQNRAQLLGLSLYDLVTAEDRPLAEAAAARLESESSIGGLELHLTDCCGRVFPGEISIGLIRANDGASDGIVAVVRDITDRKQAEEALRLSEERYKIVSEVAADYSYVVRIDPPGRLRYEWVSGNILRAGGYSLEQVNQSGFHNQLILEEDWHVMRDRLRALLAGKTYTGEFRVRVRTGEVRWLRDHAMPVWNPEHTRVAFVYGAAQDITAGKRAEEVLRENEEKFRTFLEQSSDGFVLIDETGTVIEMNPAFAQMTGMNRSYGLGRKFWDLQMEFAAPGYRNAEVIEKSRSQLMEGLVTGSAPFFYRSTDAVVCRPDGSQRIIQQVIFPIKMRSGYRVGGTFRDITESRLMEERLRTSLAEKDVLVQEIHHRVKNNFGVIISLLGLQSLYMEDPNTLKVFRDLQERIRSMVLIHEKLYQSKELARVNFGYYLREMVGSLFQVYGVDPAQVRLELDVQDIFLGIDTAIPCGLLINEIVTNSLKHAFPNGRMGRIFIGLHSEGEEWHLRVGDDGIGMSGGGSAKPPDSFGLRLVRILSEQLEASLNYSSEQGTVYELRFAHEKAGD